MHVILVLEQIIRNKKGKEKTVFFSFTLSRLQLLLSLLSAHDAAVGYSIRFDSIGLLGYSVPRILMYLQWTYMSRICVTYVSYACI